ncbi:S-type anion channel SLAH3-like [Salvia splendens]|nr:S-type anion channel SLAH3-like [Salvia splendens]
MPPSPIEAHPHNTKTVLCRHSQPILKPCRINPVYNKRFNSFKTWSGKLERQLSTIRGRHRETEQPHIQAPQEFEVLPIQRYFDALEGPELETLRVSEEIILPEDEQWPFLLRFPISSFGICLGIGSQALMWKHLSSSAAISFLHVSPFINMALWIMSASLTLAAAVLYALKMIFYFEAVRREYLHPVRVNFFFAPWIALLFLALGVPPSVDEMLPSYLWYILMAPILCLELKIFGQWMSGGERRLSKVANPSNHICVVGNFAGALLGARLGLKEGPIFFFAVGTAHYLVLFVTLYQQLPTNETLPKELHPVFFLFVAAPSVASVAWATIQGSFDYGSRIAYFIALFLYVSLGVRVNFFRGFRFSLAWWAYTCPMTGAAIATMRYSSAVTCRATQILAVTLCVVATVAVAALFVNTVVHAVVHRDLFPNDMVIAISKRRRRRRRWYHKKLGSSDVGSVEQYLRYSKSDGKDVEAAFHSSTPTNKA